MLWLSTADKFIKRYEFLWRIVICDKTELDYHHIYEDTLNIWPKNTKINIQKHKNMQSTSKKILQVGNHY